VCYVGVFVEDETEPNVGVVVLVCGLVQAGELPVVVGEHGAPAGTDQGKAAGLWVVIDYQPVACLWRPGRDTALVGDKGRGRERRATAGETCC